MPNLQGESEWALRVFSSSAASEREGADEMVELFLVAVGHQLLGSTLEIESACETEFEVQTTDSLSEYSIVSKAVPESAWPILIALVSQACKVGESVERLEVLGIQENIAAEAFTALIESWNNFKFPPDLPFAVDWGSPGEDRSGLLIEWEFSNPLSAEIAQYMGHVLFIWNQVVVFKGYSFEFEHQELTFPSEGQTSHIEPSIFRFQWRQYAGPTHSLLSLFRWTLWLHEQGCNVKKISLR